MVVVTAAAAVRLLMAATVPLVPDESYYWEWSRHLASGYFDHPGGIAHLVHAGTALAGVSALGVRLGAVTAGWLTSLLVVLLARRLSDDSGALRAAVIITCMPLAAAGLVLATPDAPLLLATAATLLFLDMALASPPGSRRALGSWLAAGAALGVAFCSKYNAVLIPVGVLIAMLAFAPLRRQLATPAPYLAALLALVVFVPVLAWNATHGWVSFTFQLAHGLGHGHGSALRREASLIASQLALVSPILFVLLALAVVRTLSRWRPRRASSRASAHARSHTSGTAPRCIMLAVIAASTFLFFCWSALAHRVEPNWQAISYVPAIVLLSSYGGAPRWRRWLGAACALGAAIVAVVYLQAASPFLPLDVESDPAARGAGWSVLASRMQSAARLADDANGGGGSDSARVWFAGNRYQDASEIAFHLAGHPTVFSLNVASRPNQYDLWPSFAERARPGDDLVLALAPPSPGRHDEVIALLRPHFDRATRASTVRSGGRTRDVWLLEGWQPHRSCFLLPALSITLRSWATLLAGCTCSTTST